MGNQSHLRTIGGRFVLITVLALFSFALTAPATAQSGTRIIFLHHSCGHNLIEEGGVREGLTALGYEFWDHGYNDDGLRNAAGDWLGENYDIPGDNTDPDGLAELFSQPLHDPPDNAFSRLMQFDVIAFKSCFPTSNIGGDDHLNELKGYYLSMRDRMDEHPEKLFVVVTQPPQVPGASDSGEAVRARELADWLGSEAFLGGHPNIVTFDFFGYLAGEDNFLRADYRYDDYDAHPNQRANATIGPLFVTFLDEAIRAFDAGEPLPESPPPAEEVPAEEVPAEVSPVEEEAPEQPSTVAAGGVIDGFETLTEPFFSNSDQPLSVIECGGDTTAAYSGERSLRLHFTIEPDGWADCGTSFDEPQDWSGGDGIAFWVHAEQAVDGATVMIFSGEADNPTPFETEFHTTESSVSGWEQITISFDAIPLAEWADTAGLHEIDPARMTGYGFNFWADEEGREGIVWIDDLSLVTSGGEAPAEPEESGEAAGAVEEEEPSFAETEEEAQGGGGLCAGAALLPVGLVGVVLLRRLTRERY